MNIIVQEKNEKQTGLFIKHIYGLNIFSANNIKVSIEEDPRIKFLRVISENTPCSAQIGSVGLNDLVDDPVELFGQQNNNFPFIRIPVGLYEGRFYVSPTDSKNCFFPQLQDGFWETEIVKNSSSDIQYLVECGALSLYITEKGVSVEIIQQMLAKSPFQSLRTDDLFQNEWLRLMTELYDLVIVTGHDGMSLLVYTREEAKMDLLFGPMNATIEAIESSAWYKQNHEFFMWDEDTHCLMRRR